jgi:5-carboxymethyl-2-hydroxymuconic-semialdehyde dehydrogenase
MRRSCHEKINHWINGKNVAGASISIPPTRPPGVLAEVASGGAAEVNQALPARGVPEMG